KERQDAVAPLVEPLTTGAFLFRVLAAIHLDHKPFLSTNKVDEIGPDGFLTHEFEASKRSGAKVSPQLLFGLRGISPQSSRQSRLRYVCAAHASRAPPPRPPTPQPGGAAPRRLPRPPTHTWGALGP